MDIQAEKLLILQQILNTTDIGLINDIKSLLNRDCDWFDELSSKQQSDISEGISQLDNNQTFTHEEAKKRFGYL